MEQDKGYYMSKYMREVSQKDDILTIYFVITLWNATFEIRRYSKGYVKPADSGFTLGSVTCLQSKKFLLLHILQISLKGLNESRLKIEYLDKGDLSWSHWAG